MRPLLFVDVDGPLIPFGNSPYPAYGEVGADGNPLLTRLDPRHGPRLLALGLDLVWATTWVDEANEIIAPRLGLPSLPLVEWTDEEPAEDGLYWKTGNVVTWAAGRPFAWFDDEVTERDQAWVRERSSAPTLLHRVDPGAGLGPSDYAAVEAWAAGLVGRIDEGAGGQR
jgi:hypothetical protein